MPERFTIECDRETGGDQPARFGSYLRRATAEAIVAQVERAWADNAEREYVGCPGPHRVVPE